MDDIREKVRQAYTEAITSVSSGGVDISDMTVGNYSDEEARETGAASFGCGDPVRAALLKEGERVLDLGSGAGMDMILAAKRVGPTGHVYGLDMTAAMLDRARKNLDKLGIRNATLLRGYIEDIPLHDGSADVLISNCVINLSPDKDRVFAEAFRVLTSGGRFCVSDVVLNKPVPEKLKQSPAAWSGWITGALPSEEYAAKLRRAGFEQVNVTITKPHEINIEVVKSTVNDLTDEDVAAIEGVSSSALITAVKPYTC